MSKSIIIIGGGIASLAAGCYAHMNGYRSQVFEMHTWQGSSCGWLLTKRTLPAMLLGMPKTLPDLHDLYLAGQ